MPSFATKVAQERFKDEIETRYGSVAAAFRALDKDHSGKLSKTELRAALLSWNVFTNAGPNEKALDEKLLGLADGDGDGEIDYAEFAAALAHAHKQRVALFGKTDDKSALAGHIAGGVANHRWGGGQVYLNENAPRGAELAEIKRQHRAAHPHPDFLEVPLPHTTTAATANQIKGDVHALKQRIATKHKLLTNAFLAFDADRSGHITRDELEAGIQHFNLGIPVEHVAQIADALDTDGDGKISYEEFASQLHSKEAQYVDLFGHGEPVEDNLLSWADPRRVGNAHLHLHREDFNAKRKQVPGPAVTRG